MADNQNSLKMWQDAASAGEDCLQLEVLERLAEDPSADRKAAVHLSGCTHCQTELAMLKSFQAAEPSANEGAAVAWIAAQLQRQQSAPAKPSAVARVSFWRNMFRVPYLAGAAALIVVLALGISLYKPDSGKNPVNGNNTGIGSYRTGDIKLLSPTGDLTQVPTEFRWEAFPGAASYKVELTDVLGQTLANATAEQTSLAIPDAMKSNMRPGKPLNWKVTAVDASGKTMASSNPERFEVK